MEACSEQGFNIVQEGQDMLRKALSKSLSVHELVLHVVLVKKKDQSLRFCVDYCHFNDPTKKDVFLLSCRGDSGQHFSGSPCTNSSPFNICFDLASIPA